MVLLVDWVHDFYSTTDRWWGLAESTVDEVDRFRADVIAGLAQPGASVLELGCGSGTTAVATAQAGFEVTGIDLSDRIERARTSQARFIKNDFYRHDFDQRFDVVCYWDGFGVGSDEDQQRLLSRIGNELLASEGHALIEVFDPTGFIADHGLTETKLARPEAGYAHSLGHRRSFDMATSVATDTWWDLDDEVPIEHAQMLRCYSPAEFAQLVAPTPLRLQHILGVGRSDWSYITLLAARPTQTDESAHA